MCCSRWRALTFGILWYSSILTGYAGLFCPLLPILLVSNKLYRYLTDVIFVFWQSYPTALLQIWCGTDVQVLGDPIASQENSLLVMNHRTRTDWLFLWSVLYHGTRGPSRYKHSTKFVLKDVIRHIPGIGWVMQLSCFLYVKRNWSVDRGRLKKVLDYFCSLSYNYSLLVFPEGTDLTPQTIIRSKEFAQKNNLPAYEFVLHPRTTGFAFLAQHLISQKSLDAIYDVTLVYPDAVPQNEKLLFFKGLFPKQVKIHLTRYPLSALSKDQHSLEVFLRDRWSEKEKVLKEFYETGHFLHGEILRRTSKAMLYASLLFWTFSQMVTVYCIYEHFWFRNYVVAHTALLFALNWFCVGFPEVEVGMYELKQMIFQSPF